MSEIVVFVGPSLAAGRAAQLLPEAEIRPPIRRDELRAARRRGGRVLVILDGVFAHSLAVSPREIVEVMRSGAVVVGASSMGAIRAAECAPAGMLGIGEVYDGFWDGSLDSDDEVAVVTDPEDGDRPLSVPLVAVRAGLRHARATALLGEADCDLVWSAASGLHFSQRTWGSILKRAGLADPALRRALEACPDPKREDAVAALRFVADNSARLLADSSPGGPRIRFGSEERYSGHDPLLGRSPAEARRELLRWLVGSGRLQRYVWALVAGEAELATAAGAKPAERPVRLREALARVLARLLEDPDLLAERVWLELEFLEELDAELLFLHAVRTAADAATDGESLVWARERVAIAQGYRDWTALSDDVVDGAVYGALPKPWVDEAVLLLAAARH